MGLMRTGDAMDTILNAIADGRTIKEACELAGVSRSAHHFWLKNDVPYQEGYKMAVTMRTGLLESILTSRALEGYDETKTTYTLLPDGTEIPVEKIVTHKHDNGLALRLLSALDDTYNAKIKTEVTSNTTVAEILASARKRLSDLRGDKEPDADEEKS